MYKFYLLCSLLICFEIILPIDFDFVTKALGIRNNYMYLFCFNKINVFVLRRVLVLKDWQLDR